MSTKSAHFRIPLTSPEAFYFLGTYNLKASDNPTYTVINLNEFPNSILENMIVALEAGLLESSDITSDAIRSYILTNS